MTLVFIYGPPAVGKLTTAKSLAKITGYPIFHNHLSIDLITSTFKFGDDIFLKLSDEIRLLMFKAAAQEKINGLIFTFCYSDPIDNNFVKKTINTIKKYNGRLVFVRLSCENKILFKRVVNNSRQSSSKIKDKEKLQKAIIKWNLLSSKIKYPTQIEINNSKLKPEASAKLIKKHFQLK
ncbi:MAG: AAA family ATPase [Patescibacteria group bacterium]|jgi:RNase adaptor protein for sRNA GlmZ degradation